MSFKENSKETKSLNDSLNSNLISSSSKLLSHVKYEHLIAGISGGVTSTLILQPLDLLKVRLAVSDGRVKNRPEYRGLTNAIGTIIKQEGIKGFYRGVVPNCWGAGASWGFYFLFYNAIKSKMFDGNKTNQSLGSLKHITAATEAGVLTLFITNPIWVVKTRMCLQFGSSAQINLPPSKQYSGMFNALYKVYKYEGLHGLYKGFVPGLFGVSHGALQFMAYEKLKELYIEKYELQPNAKLGTFAYLSCAALSKLFAVSITYPYQVIRARLQDQYTSYNGVFDVIKRTWNFEGYKGYYKGLMPNLLRVVPACCITFVIYEHTSSLLLNKS